MGPLDPAVVLVRPRLPANLGAVARVVKNFGVADVRLVEPAASPDEEAHRLASGADDRLDAMRRYPTLEAAVAEFPIVIATSSLRGREERRFLHLSDLPGLLAQSSASARVAFVFGPERSGLTESERARASMSLRLPTEPGFPTMNLSHAVAVVLAASRFLHETRQDESGELAAARDVEGALEHWDRALEAIGFYDTGHREKSLRDWRRIIASRPVTAREAAILRGVAHRILVSLRRSQLSAVSSQPAEDPKD